MKRWHGVIADFAPEANVPDGERKISKKTVTNRQAAASSY